MLFEALRPQAALVIVPIWGKKAEVDMQKIVLKELDVRGTISYVSNHPEAIELVESGKLDLTPFITSTTSSTRASTPSFTAMKPP